MRTLISLLVVSLLVIGQSTQAAVAATARSSGPHAVQGRAKKKARPQKAKKAEKTAEKTDKKPKKNDRGFEL